MARLVIGVSSGTGIGAVTLTVEQHGLRLLDLACAALASTTKHGGGHSREFIFRYLYSFKAKEGNNKLKQTQRENNQARMIITLSQYAAPRKQPRINRKGEERDCMHQRGMSQKASEIKHKRSEKVQTTQDATIYYAQRYIKMRTRN